MNDAEIIWSVGWAMFAVAAGFGLAAAAIAFFRGLVHERYYDFDAGYNALAPVVD